MLPVSVSLLVNREDPFEGTDSHDCGGWQGMAADEIEEDLMLQSQV